MIEKVERTDRLALDRAGAGYRIEFQIPGATVVHVLKIPTQRQMMDYGDSSVRVIHGRRLQEIHVSLEPAAELYDRILESTEGYAGAVPIIHKAAAVTELIAQLNAEDEEEAPEA